MGELHGLVRLGHGLADLGVGARHVLVQPLAVLAGQEVEPHPVVRPVHGFARLLQGLFEPGAFVRREPLHHLGPKMPVLEVLIVEHHGADRAALLANRPPGPVAPGIALQVRRVDHHVRMGCRRSRGRRRGGRRRRRGQLGGLRRGWRRGRCGGRGQGDAAGQGGQAGAGQDGGGPGAAGAGSRGLQDRLQPALGAAAAKAGESGNRLGRSGQLQGGDQGVGVGAAAAGIAALERPRVAGLLAGGGQALARGGEEGVEPVKADHGLLHQVREVIAGGEVGAFVGADEGGLVGREAVEQAAGQEDGRAGEPCQHRRGGVGQAHAAAEAPGELGIGDGLRARLQPRHAAQAQGELAEAHGGAGGGEAEQQGGDRKARSGSLGRRRRRRGQRLEAHGRLDQGDHRFGVHHRL